ncbi:hypothetical protein AYI68_g6373 [Smittium mucronatum]|uniref:Globin-sensor domain-containing protein n=1 Tax=Smittium mucronatum TaxID=133383 RepID=A0A1R0GRM7_9FUNG|nr:hypothetical protein AYI68_g6373 [Smittium mucronatum]
MEYLTNFIEFSADDHRSIKNASDLLQPLLSTITDVVYDKLFEYDITKASFTVEQSGFDGPIKSDLNEAKVTDPVIVYRKTMLKKYLHKILNDELGPKFTKYLYWVGEIHSNTRYKTSSSDVEFINLNALTGFVTAALMNIINDSTQASWTPEERNKTLIAFSKFFWIQNDTFLMYHAILQDKVAELSRAPPKAESSPNTISSYGPTAANALLGFGIGAFLTMAISKLFK